MEYTTRDLSLIVAQHHDRRRLDLKDSGSNETRFSRAEVIRCNFHWCFTSGAGKFLRRQSAYQ